jgi:hypothetical protein
MGTRLRRFAVWSNVFYLVPLVAALSFGLPWVALVLLFLTMFSTAFHLLNEKEFIVSDYDAAMLVIFFNLGLIVYGQHGAVSLALVAVFSALALLVRYRFEHGDRGGTAHGWWHVLSAMVTLLCVMSYTLPF